MRKSRKKRNRRALLSMQSLAAVFTLLLVLSGFLFGSLLSRAGDSNQASAPIYKYYTSIRVQDGDTLWEIADSYLDESSLEKKDYIEEIKRLNKINENEIQSGQHLLIPYYSDEYL